MAFLACNELAFLYWQRFKKEKQFDNNMCAFHGISFRVPLVPEFKQIVHQDSQAPLPPHAPLLSTPKRGYVASAKESKDNQVTVGVHFSPEEFLNEAVRLCHPTEHNSLFPREIRANIAYLSSKTVHQVAQERAGEVKRWVALSKELFAKKQDLKSSISPRIAEVLKDERLLNEAGHEDIGLVDDIKKGFELTGALPRSGVFNQKFRPASMTCEDLRKVSNLSRDVLLEPVLSSGDRETDLRAHKQRRTPCGVHSHKTFPCETKNKVRPMNFAVAPEASS